MRGMSGSNGSTTLPPRALIVSLYGLYARESGGWLSVATLVKLLAQVGVEEAAVRSAISRLKRRGVIAPERVDGSAGYTIAEHTRRMLDLGDRRIFDRKQASLSDGWLLAVFSVPEAERDQRHLLRSRLAWLGFGTVSAGTWIAPQHLEDEAREALDGFGPYVELFRADHLGFGVLPEKIASWWDLAELSQQYSDFDRAHAAVLTAWRRRRSIDDAEAFGDYLRTLTAWRRLPYLDPGLPASLLPTGWAGTRAAATFEAIRARLADPAHAFVDAVRT
jgi:phenylacetic acid degradation operon negative regulatory protein